MQNMSLAAAAYRKYKDLALRTAFCYLSSLPEAEDIVQEVFLQLHTHPVTFTDDDHMKAWILRVTINKSKDALRKRKHRNEQPLDETIWSLPAAEDARTRELWQQVLSLPKHYAEVLYLYYYMGFSIKEIAVILKKRPNTVGALLRRGRARLRMELEE